ncbi:hypothetical protein NP493_576g01002 [Ridgeia piscesae]|uniref:Uncharacterized protein n=1 Tax=Ridgeia piscesae TaxID=27915 RepID=A0AAD9KUE0_RIDPI|nr:hypothetical protein NP493_576g01002 [Ridgeia piscesae]
MAVLNTAHTSEDEHSSDTEKSGFVDDDDDIGSAWDLIQENDLDPDPEWNQTTGDDKRLFVNSPDSNDSGIQADVPHVRAPETEDLYAVVTKEKGKSDDREEEEEEEEDDDERTSRLAREAQQQQETRQVEPEPAEELPPGWEKHEDEKGAYYFHVKSGTTQYEPPSPDFDKQQRAQSSNENLAATMPSSSPVTANGGTSDSEQHLQEFEGHAVKYVEHSLRAMAPPKETRSQAGGGDQQPVRFSVRSLGWVGIAEEDLTPERSSKAVNRCIVDLSLGRNYINDVVGRWGEGKDLLMDLDDHHLVLINPQDMTVLHVQPIHSIRVWGVGRDNGRDFAFVARDSRTRQHLCHVFRCDMPARRIANTLRDICRKLLVDRSMHQPQGGAAVARPQNLPNLERCDQPSGQVTFESLMKNTSFPTPMEEPKKVLRCHYLGTAQVPNATGVDIANSAMHKVYAGVPPEKWLFVSVAVAPSTITITEHGKPDNVLAECRVRFLSFLGIAMKNAKLCSFIMHTAQNHFIAHVFHCEPSAGQLCKTIEAACKLRYQKCLDSHQKEPPEQKPHSDPRPPKSLGSTLKAGMQNVFGKFKKSS